MRALPGDFAMLILGSEGHTDPQVVENLRRSLGLDRPLLVQYLVSRSHQHGGRTLDGRLTLLELVRRLRYGGYLDKHGITEQDQFEILEKLVDDLAGTGSVKLYYIVDRRNFLDKVKSVYARYAM